MSDAVYEHTKMDEDSIISMTVSKLDMKIGEEVLKLWSFKLA